MHFVRVCLAASDVALYVCDTCTCIGLLRAWIDGLMDARSLAYDL